MGDFYRQAVEDEATIKAMEKDIKEAEKKAEQAEKAALAIQKEARTNTAEYHAKKETTNTQGKEFPRRFFVQQHWGARPAQRDPNYLNPAPQPRGPPPAIPDWMSPRTGRMFQAQHIAYQMGLPVFKATWLHGPEPIKAAKHIRTKARSKRTTAADCRNKALSG